LRSEAISTSASGKKWDADEASILVIMNAELVKLR